jgi:hypothetical protein
VGAGLRDRLNDARAFHLLTVLKLRLKSPMTCNGDGKPIHILVPLVESKSEARRASAALQAK